MTDSKTPEWVKEEVLQVYASVCDAEPISSHCRSIISQALLSAYERGRKEGIEEAAKVAGAHQATPRLFPYGGSPTENEAAEAGQEFAADEIEAAIRQLLEVKG